MDFKRSDASQFSMGDQCDHHMDTEDEFQIKQEIKTEQFSGPEFMFVDVTNYEALHDVAQCMKIENNDAESTKKEAMAPRVSSNTKYLMDFETSFVKDEIEIVEFTFPPLETENDEKGCIDEAQVIKTQSTDGPLNLGLNFHLPVPSFNTSSNDYIVKNEIEIEEFIFPPLETENVQGHSDETQSNKTQDKSADGVCNLEPHLSTPQPSSSTHSLMDVEDDMVKDAIEIEEFTFPQLDTENDGIRIDEAQTNVSQDTRANASHNLEPPCHLPVSADTPSKERSSSLVSPTNPSLPIKSTISRTTNLISARNSNDATCAICKSKFENDEALMEHCASLHTVGYISMCARTYQRPFRALHCKVVNCMWKTTSVCFERGELILQLKIHSEMNHNNWFVCEYCLGMFKDKAKFCDHNKKYHPNHKCEFATGNNCDCGPKQKVVMGSPKVTKTICGVENCKWSTSTTDKQQLLCEVRKHIELSHSHLHPCNYCLSIFTNVKQRHTHVMEKHTKSCSICDFKDVSDAALLHHCRTTHTVPSNVRLVFDKPRKELNFSKSKKLKAIFCQVKDCCYSVTLVKPEQVYSELKNHCDTRHKGVQVCLRCFAMFTSVNELYLHVDNNHMFPCNICSCIFTSEVYVLKHQRSEHSVTSNWNCNTESSEIESQDNVVSGFVTSMVGNQVVRTCLICGCKLYNNANVFTHNMTFHLVSTDIDMSKVNFITPIIRKFQCIKCFSEFTRLSILKTHYSRVHHINLLCSETEGARFSCTLCDKSLKSNNINSICHHYQSAHEQEFDTKLLDFSNWYNPIINEQSVYENSLIFTCKLCTDYCTSFKELILHYTHFHDCFACGKCKAVFESKNELSMHLIEVHFITCSMCSFQTEYSQTMIRHMSLSHSKIILDNRPNTNTTTNSSSDILCNLCPTHVMTTKRNTKMHYFYFHSKYACEYCWQTFVGSNALHKHILDNHLTECIHCKCNFDDLKTLETHVMSTHPNVKYNFCEVCGEHLNNGDLKLHRESHNQYSKKNKFNSYEKTSRPNFLCSKCGLKFCHKNQYEKHMKNLHPESDINCGNFCKLCNKKYKNITLHRYISHKEIYEKENGPKKGPRFQCSFCKRMSRSIYDLLKHMKRHSKYKCKQCLMQFNLLPHLEEHVSELHTNRYAYSCTVCSKVLANEADYDLHMSFHPSAAHVQPDLLSVLRCDLCDHFCLNRDAMEAHVKSKHIKAGKLINVKRKKPLGRKPYIKRVF